MSFTQIETFFFKTFNHFAAALVFSLALIIVEFSPFIYKVLSNFDGAKSYTVSSTSQYVSGILASLNAIPFAATIITGLVWGLTGLLVYTIFYLLSNILIDTKNEIYSAADKSAEGASSSEVIQHAGGKLAAAILYMLFVGISILYLIKMWLSMFYIYGYSGMQVTSLPYALGGFVGLTLNLYLAFVFALLIWRNNEMEQYALR